MHIHFTPQSIDALAQVISGGNGEDRIGIYRSGPKIESFMRSCNVSMHIGSGSRLPTLVQALKQANRSEDQMILRTIAQRSADPRDFLDDPAKHVRVLEYLNARLRYDGLELQMVGEKVRLAPAGQSAAVIDALTTTIAVIDFDTVNHDLERAMSNVDTDPEDAVTAACSILESVCRSILVELAISLPVQKDIQGLYKAVREPLGLDPAKSGVPDVIASDVRTILGGLNSIVQGIGALRTLGATPMDGNEDPKKHRQADCSSCYSLSKRRRSVPDRNLAVEISGSNTPRSARPIPSNPAWGAVSLIRDIGCTSSQFQYKDAAPISRQGS